LQRVKDLSHQHAAAKQQQIKVDLDHDDILLGDDNNNDNDDDDDNNDGGMGDHSLQHDDLDRSHNERHKNHSIFEGSMDNVQLQQKFHRSHSHGNKPHGRGNRRHHHSTAKLGNSATKLCAGIEKLAGQSSSPNILDHSMEFKQATTTSNCAGADLSEAEKKAAKLKEISSSFKKTKAQLK